MKFTLLFKLPQLGAPVLAHATGNQGHDDWSLCLVTSREGLERLRPRLSGHQRATLHEHERELPERTAEDIDIFAGDVARTFMEMINMLYASDGRGARAGRKPELIHISPPSPYVKRGEAIIMWYSKEEGYCVSIVRAKDQAKKVIAALRFMAAEERETMLGEVAEWNLPDTAEETVREMTGAVAELLCKSGKQLKASQQRAKAQRLEAA